MADGLTVVYLYDDLLIIARQSTVDRYAWSEAATRTRQIPLAGDDERAIATEGKFEGRD